MSLWGKLAGIAGIAAAPLTGGTSLAWLPAALGAGAAVDSAISGRTGGYNPNAQTPPADPQASGSSWMDILPFLVGAGSNIAGTALQARAQGQGNDLLRERASMFDKQAEEERKRRDYYASILLPNLMRGSGFNQAQIGRQMAQNPSTPLNQELERQRQAAAALAARRG